MLRLRDRVLATAIAGSALTVISPSSTACYPPCGWGSLADEQAVCVSSVPTRDAALTCWCSGACAGPCAAWCSSWTACESSGVPSCVPSGSTAACDACMETSCSAETAACSTDTTGCVSSCAAWLGGGAICDGGTAEESALSDCACGGACAAKCAGSCLASGYGGHYLDNDLARAPQCVACLQNKNGCETEYVDCLSK